MGTRGLIGFEKNGIKKATYNHLDSHPSCLGVNIAKELKDFTIEQLNEAFDNIVSVGNKKPTAKQIKECKEYANINVSEGRLTTWYCLLRETQGTLLPYLKKELRYMIDENDFLEDSLFCEWAYIVNLDSNTLDVYEGFQEDPSREKNEIGIPIYLPCKKIKSFPLDKLPTEKELTELEREE